jgi:hypothetical protein
MMEQFLEERFSAELKTQCQFAAFSLEDIHIALESNVGVGRIWFSLQNLLNSAANISKMLWPVKNSYSDRGQFLRNKYNIRDDSPLKSRRVRNCFEHFDEHLHEWVLSLNNHSVIDRNIGPAQMFCPTGNYENDKKYFLRNFDQGSFELLFRGQEFSLGPVIQEIQNLVNQLESCSS